MLNMRRQLLFLTAWISLASPLRAGPYTEVGVNGYIGDDHRHANPLTDDDARINPIFRAWATDFVNYEPSDSNWTGHWNNPKKALGPATGDGNGGSCGHALVRTALPVADEPCDSV